MDDWAFTATHVIIGRDEEGREVRVEVMSKLGELLQAHEWSDALSAWLG